MPLVLVLTVPVDNGVEERGKKEEAKECANSDKSDGVEKRKVLSLSATRTPELALALVVIGIVILVKEGVNCDDNGKE